MANHGEDPSSRESLDRIMKLEAENAQLRARKNDLLEKVAV